MTDEPAATEGDDSSSSGGDESTPSDVDDASSSGDEFTTCDVDGSTSSDVDESTPSDDAAASRSEASAASDAGESVTSQGSESTPAEFDDSAVDEDDGGSFLGNLTSPRKQLGDAAAAFRNARGAGGLPRDDEDRVKLVCRRHAERRAVPLDDLGRPACFDADHPDCEGCLEDVRDGTVETW